MAPPSGCKHAARSCRRPLRRGRGRRDCCRCSPGWRGRPSRAHRCVHGQSTRSWNVTRAPKAQSSDNIQLKPPLRPPLGSRPRKSAWAEEVGLGRGGFLVGGGGGGGDRAAHAHGGGDQHRGDQRLAATTDGGRSFTAYAHPPHPQRPDNHPPGALRRRPPVPGTARKSRRSRGANCPGLVTDRVRGVGEDTGPARSGTSSCLRSSRHGQQRVTRRLTPQ